MSIHRCFLIIEKKQSCTSEYHQAHVHLSILDPCTADYTYPFLSSPLFSLHREGVDELPVISKATKISFFMIANPFPVYGQLLEQIQFNNEAWFSLGLANFVLLDNTDSYTLTSKVIEFLTKAGCPLRYEYWEIMDPEIILPDFEPKTISSEKFNLKISEKVPLNVQFIISELFLAANQILSESKTFSPHYFEDYKAILEASLDLVTDLEYLYGDETKQPSKSILSSEKFATKDELINDRIGRLVQFSSSLSYIISQTFTGVFPILRNTGFIHRHSLLGIGTATAALFEIMKQLEETFYSINLESIFQIPSVQPTMSVPNEVKRTDDTEFLKYSTEKVPKTFLSSYSLPDTHSIENWKDDRIRLTIISSNSPKKYETLSPEDKSKFFNRFAFFSGRLGFREYDFSATSALQVLVESNSLKWNIINYTHEIIHNHVRIILTKILNTEIDHKSVEQFLQQQLILIQAAINDPTKQLSYTEWFQYILFLYCINSEYFGSLSKEWDPSHFIEQTQSNTPWQFPQPLELLDVIRDSYKDISEIFVHVIDFAYIYKRNLPEYIESIWCSWATVSPVSTNLKHYILRTLLIYAINEDGTPQVRFDECKKKFQKFIETIIKNGNTLSLFSHIDEILKDTDELKDLRFRFYNSLTVADLANLFFVFNIENYLDRNDPNVNDGKLHTSENNNDTTNEHIYYQVDFGGFENTNIISKLRFVFDQLCHSIHYGKAETNFQKIERDSAWLLLTTSSYSYD